MTQAQINNALRRLSSLDCKRGQAPQAINTVRRILADACTGYVNLLNGKVLVQEMRTIDNLAQHDLTGAEWLFPQVVQQAHQVILADYNFSITQCQTALKRALTFPSNYIEITLVVQALTRCPLLTNDHNFKIDLAYRHNLVQVRDIYRLPLVTIQEAIHNEILNLDYLKATVNN